MDGESFLRKRLADARIATDQAIAGQLTPAVWLLRVSRLTVAVLVHEAMVRGLLDGPKGYSRLQLNLTACQCGVELELAGIALDNPAAVHATVERVICYSAEGVWM
jgi:hypothetical protein